MKVNFLPTFPRYSSSGHEEEEVEEDEEVYLPDLPAVAVVLAVLPLALVDVLGALVATDNGHGADARQVADGQVAALVEPLPALLGGLGQLLSKLGLLLGAPQQVEPEL